MGFHQILLTLIFTRQIAALCSGSTTIHSITAYNSISTCTTYSGGIAIATDFPDQDVTLGGIRLVGGDLVVKDVPALSHFNGVMFSNIEGSVIFDDLPNLQTISFGLWETAESFQLSNLPSLQDFSVPGDRQSDLIRATMTVRNTSLSTFKSMSYVRTLTNLEIADNDKLSGIDLTDLRTILNDLTITANPELDEIDFLPNLLIVNGILNCTGRFTKASFPALEYADAIILESSKNIDSSCQAVKSLSKNVTCRSGVSIASSSAAAATNSASSPNPSHSVDGLSSEAKIGIGVGVGVGALALLTSGAFVFRRRRKNGGDVDESFHRKASDSNDVHPPNSSSLNKGPKAELSEDFARHELEQPSSLSELPAQQGQPEMGRNLSSRYPGMESRHEI